MTVLLETAINHIANEAEGGGCYLKKQMDNIGWCVVVSIVCRRGDRRRKGSKISDTSALAPAVHGVENAAR